MNAVASLHCQPGLFACTSSPVTTMLSCVFGIARWSSMYARVDIPIPRRSTSTYIAFKSALLRCHNFPTSTTILSTPLTCPFATMLQNAASGIARAKLCRMPGCSNANKKKLQSKVAQDHNQGRAICASTASRP